MRRVRSQQLLCRSFLARDKRFLAFSLERQSGDMEADFMRASLGAASGGAGLAGAKQMRIMLRNQKRGENPALARCLEDLLQASLLPKTKDKSKLGFGVLDNCLWRATPGKPTKRADLVEAFSPLTEIQPIDRISAA
jgi:hypothetical protein